MKKIIIVIEKIQEGDDTYFLAQTNDLEWFLAEWDTLEEVIKNALDVTKECILEIESKRLNKNTDSISIEKLLQSYDISQHFSWLAMA